MVADATGVSLLYTNTYPLNGCVDCSDSLEDADTAVTSPGMVIAKPADAVLASAGISIS